MFKITGVLLASYLAQAIPDFPTTDRLLAGADNAGNQESSCHGTIRSGYIYASK
jgi:hypothetical protein